MKPYQQTNQPFHVVVKVIIIYIYTIYQPLRSGRIWHKVNF